MDNSVCLYGSQSCGFGFITSTGHGDGEPSPRRSATAAMWEGLRHLRDGGATTARVFAPGGRLVAQVDLRRSPWPYFGELRWSAAPVLVLSAADVIAAAEGGGA